MYARGGPRPQPGTLNQLLFEAIEKYNKPDAMQVRVGEQYTPISHAVLLDRIRKVSYGLREIGIRRGDRVAILSENRPEWAIADFTCLTSGITDVPLYPSLPAEQLVYPLRDSGAVAIFVSTEVQAAKIAAIRGEVPALKTVIVFDRSAAKSADMTLETLEGRGATGDSPARAAEFRAEALRVKPNDLATIIYTSGTTGEPKGVMLSHDNIYSNVAATRHAIVMRGDDVSLSFLPLSHILQRMGDYWFLATGTSIAYVDSFDLVPLAMGQVRPTIAISVPRLYEKMYARVLENALAGGAVKKRIFFWARGVADRWADLKLAGREPRGLLAFQYGIAQKLVFSKLKARTGGRLRYFVSGGAPLAPEINKFFYAAGLVILEGYGLTETSPVIGVNTPDNFRIGTIGKPIDGVEVKIAEDGEILTRGPHVMQGYYNKPEETGRVLDEEGFYHTGDVGYVDADGHFYVTDRIKDLFKLSNGKYVAPLQVESLLKQSPLISQPVVVGSGRKQVGALIVPDWDALKEALKEDDIATNGSREELCENPQVVKRVQRDAVELTRELSDYERVKRIYLLPREFSIDKGEMTPTLKIKRSVIDEKYEEAIDEICGS